MLIFIKAISHRDRFWATISDWTHRCQLGCPLRNLGLRPHLAGFPLATRSRRTS